MSPFELMPHMPVNCAPGTSMLVKVRFASGIGVPDWATAKVTAKSRKTGSAILKENCMSRPPDVTAGGANQDLPTLCPVSKPSQGEKDFGPAATLNALISSFGAAA